MYKKCQKVVHMFILTNFLTPYHSNAPYSIKELHVNAHYIPKVSTNFSTRNCIHFLLLGQGNVRNVPKSPISGHFGLFSNPYPTVKPLTLP